MVTRLVLNGQGEKSAAQQSHISIRLPSGEFLTSTFATTATLDDEVRSFILSAAPDLKHQTFAFKYLAAPPQAALAISTSEEHSSLLALGLVPSATLILELVKSQVEQAHETVGASARQAQFNNERSRVAIQAQEYNVYGPNIIKSVLMVCPRTIIESNADSSFGITVLGMTTANSY